MLLLDLFCGPGGAARGYAEAGFEVIGVDIEFNPHYPFEMFVGDALSFASRFGSHFDIIHASPPCQQFSSLNAIHKKNYPDYIEATRKVCKTLKKPYIIENVVGAPLKDPIMLCGTMFPELRVIRHRLFESNIPLVPPPHLPEKDHPIVHTLDRRNKNFGKTDEWTAYLSITGGGNSTSAASRDAMQLDLPKQELNKAIPSLYTKYLGKQALEFLEQKSF